MSCVLGYIFDEKNTSVRFQSSFSSLVLFRVKLLVVGTSRRVEPQLSSQEQRNANPKFAFRQRGDQALLYIAAVFSLGDFPQSAADTTSANSED